MLLAIRPRRLCGGWWATRRGLTARYPPHRPAAQRRAVKARGLPEALQAEMAQISACGVSPVKFFAQADVFVVTNDQVIHHLDFQHLAGLNHLPGCLNIIG